MMIVDVLGTDQPHIQALSSAIAATVGLGNIKWGWR